jgi:hypothetical protein
MFACIREEVDSTSNKSKEDRVVINGLKSATPLPTDSRTRENQEKSSNQEKACQNSKKSNQKSQKLENITASEKRKENDKAPLISIPRTKRSVLGKKKLDSA